MGGTSSLVCWVECSQVNCSVARPRYTPMAVSSEGNCMQGFVVGRHLFNESVQAETRGSDPRADGYYQYPVGC